jgi:hypothetical protein
MNILDAGENENIKNLQNIEKDNQNEKCIFEEEQKISDYNVAQLKNYIK